MIRRNRNRSVECVGKEKGRRGRATTLKDCHKGKYVETGQTLTGREGERKPTIRSVLVDHALQYAGRGWKIFPLQGKIPFKGTQGFKDATTDPAIIEAWWARWPQANIGIATGNGLVVLDIDGPEGLAELKALIARHGPLPATLAVRTGNGIHLYFRDVGSAGLSGSVRSSARGKLHVRSEGGYVVAPPSLHPSGKVYQWINPELTVANLPSWLKEWMLNGSNQAKKETANLRSHELPSYLRSLPDRGLSRLALSAIKEAESTWSPQEQKRIESALAAIPADNYEIWFKIGMILQSLQWIRGDGSDLGLELWDAWSATCQSKYPGRGAIETKWASFGRSGAGGLGLGTLFALAREAEWTESAADHANVNEKVNGHESVKAALPPQFSDTARAVIFPDLDKSKRPKQTCRNARMAISGLGIACSHDLFHRRMIVGGRIMEEYAGELSDDAVQMLRVMIGQSYGFDPGLMNTHDAVVQECLQKPFDPVCDYLDGLQWDGTPRIEQWFNRYLGAADTPLHRAMSRISLVAAVRRAYEPGVKFDQIIVLEGPEGRGKSGAIKILAGEDNFSDQTILPLHDKEQQEALQGVWLYEIADLTGIGRAEVEKIKAFASRTVDRARPAYGRSRVDRPRRCIFFATTNNETYLKSQTGNRRFWPVVTGRIDLEGLARDRDQLWAEAAEVEARGASVMLGAELWGKAAELQASRVDQDPWDDLLADVVGKALVNGNGQPEERISSRDLLELHLKIAADKQHDNLNKRLAYVMRRLKWEGPIVLRSDSGQFRGYSRPISWAVLEARTEALRKRQEKS